MDKELARKKILLATKQSFRNERITYCVGVFKLGTPQIEFIYGEVDSNKGYQAGEQVYYIDNAEYADSLQSALDWLRKSK